MKELHYYYRDEKNRPMVTVYLIEVGGVVAKGIAVCSPKDNPNKKVGRAIARGKALKALKRKANNDLIVRFEAAQTLFTLPDYPVMRGDFKSEYDVKYLNEREKKLLQTK